MSVDTYLEGKNQAAYLKQRHDDITVLVSPRLVQYATEAVLDARKGLLRRSFELDFDHRHGPHCSH